MPPKSKLKESPSKPSRRSLSPDTSPTPTPRKRGRPRKDIAIPVDTKRTRIVSHNPEVKYKAKAYVDLAASDDSDNRDADDEEGEDIEGEDDEGEDDEGEDDEPLAKKGKTGKVVKAPVTDSSDIEIMVPSVNKSKHSPVSKKQSGTKVVAGVDTDTIFGEGKRSSSPKKKKMDSSDGTFHDDSHLFEANNPLAEKPPKACEVTDKSLFDPMLQDTYANLPPLRAGSLETSNNGVTPHSSFYVSNVADQFPNADLETILNAITFTRAGMFVNPSRAPPVCVKVGNSTDTQRSTAYAINANAQYSHIYTTFTSVLLITTANLSLNAESPSPYRGVNGLLCSQEWERFCAFFCMVFKQVDLAAQVYENAIAITTRAKPKDNKRDTSSRAQSDKLTKLTTRPGPSSPSKSPLKSPVKVTGTSQGNVKAALNHDDPIPVYDGRRHLKMNKLNKVHELPPFDGDVAGTVSLVGYTANVWTNNKGVKQLSLNIQWICVLATDDED